jgi:ferric enterobactin receptor
VDIPLGDRASFLLTGRKSYQSELYKKIFNKYGSQSVNPMSRSGFGPGPAGPSGQGFAAQFQNAPDSYFYDLNAKLSYRPSARDDVFLSFFNGKDDLDNSRTMEAPSFLTDQGINFNNDITDVTEWGNLAIGLNWHHRWNDVNFSRLSIGYSNYFNNRDNGANMSIDQTEETKRIERKTQENNNVKDLTLRFDNVFRLAGWNQAEFGAQITRNDIRYLYVYNNSEDGLPIPGRGAINRIADDMNREENGTTSSIYLQDRLKLSRFITLLPGFRLTYFDKTKTVYSEPRVSFTLNLSDRLKLKGAWGRYYQYANQMTREDNMQGNREFWTLADGQSIPVSSSIHLISGISYENEDWLVDVEAYRKTLTGLSEFALRFAPQEGEIDYNDYFFTGTGTAKGIEILAQRKFGRLTGWITYDLGKVEYLFPRYGDQPFPASHDVTHELKLVSNYQFNKQWNFASTFIFATGRPYTEPAGIEQIIMPDDRTFDRVVFGAKNTARLPAYIRLDLSATYDFPIGSTKASICASVFNTLNRKNVWYKEYEVVEGEVLETDVTYLGITPNVSFTLYLK